MMKIWKQLTVACMAGIMLCAGPAAAEEAVKTELCITAGETEIVLINETKLDVTFETEDTDLILTETDGKRHCFKAFFAQTLTDLRLTKDGSFLYIAGMDANGSEMELTEDAKEKALPESTEMKTLAKMNLRAEPSAEGEVLTILEEGTTVLALEELPGWYKVEADGKTGYLMHSYVKAEKEAAEEASGEVYEVSRQAYDDCDGSGHGHFEITYSDGTVGYEKY